MKRIILEDISKEFVISGAFERTALEGLVNIFHKPRLRKLRVLKDLTMDVHSGETIGLIGKNGSGKSTLLRIIAGIYTADSGQVQVNGSLIYLNGLAPGLKMKLTMRENIFLIGSILGLGQQEIGDKFDKIVSFSGLEDFVDTKIFQFSSGMIARLAFSSTIHFVQHRNPDIILLDEVFGSGGDIDFQKKATDKMKELMVGGATVLLVSHNLFIIRQYCNRVILLEKGSIRKTGPAEEVCVEYESL